MLLEDTMEKKYGAYIAQTLEFKPTDGLDSAFGLNVVSLDGLTQDGTFTHIPYKELRYRFRVISFTGKEFKRMLQTECPLINWRDSVMKRWPKIVAGMICESLGYFTPESAAMALVLWIKKEPCYCEWYDSCVRGPTTKEGYEYQLKEIGDSVVKCAISRRHMHTGYMSDKRKGRAVVNASLAGKGPELMSW